MVHHTQGVSEPSRPPVLSAVPAGTKRTWWKCSPFPSPLWERTDSNGARTVSRGGKQALEEAEARASGFEKVVTEITL